MPQAARLGDTIGHTKPGDGPKGGGGGDVTGKIIGPCSGNVFTNGIKAARAHLDETVCSKHDQAPPPIATGSPTVFINGLPAARVSDKIACGAFITEGSSNVFIGGGGVKTDAVMPEGLAAPGLKETLLMGATGATLAFGSPPEATADLLRQSRIKTAKVPPPPSPPPRPRGEASYIDGTSHSVIYDAGNLRKKVTIGKPTVRMFKFDGTNQETQALVYPVTIDDQKIELIVKRIPGKNATGMALPSVRTIANSLAIIEKEQLKATREVVFSPVAAARDDPNSKYYTAALASHGRFTVFPGPRKDTGDQGAMDSLVLHETAHFLHQAEWPENPEQEERWIAAGEEDGRNPSLYAKADAHEDFAESVVMYRISKGTALEEKARSLFPARYEILDEIFHPPQNTEK